MRSGYGSLNGLADEAVPLCGLEEAGVEEGTSKVKGGGDRNKIVAEIIYN